MIIKGRRGEQIKMENGQNDCLFCRALHVLTWHDPLVDQLFPRPPLLQLQLENWAPERQRQEAQETRVSQRTMSDMRARLNRRTYHLYLSSRPQSLRGTNITHNLGASPPNNEESYLLWKEVIHIALYTLFIHRSLLMSRITNLWSCVRR